MGSASQCPRGHALEDDAVYCTVCWIRVEPEDPVAVAARQRRRRRIWLPLIGASALVVGVAVGGTAAVVSKTPGSETVVAGEAVPTQAPLPSASPSEEAVAVTAEPLAATVADPVQDAQGACTVDVREQRLACSTAADQLAFTVCVPDATSTVEVRMRANEDLPWGDVSSDVVIGEQGACASGERAADVVIDEATAGRDGGIWRLVVSDVNGDRLWRSRIVVVEDGS